MSEITKDLLANARAMAEKARAALDAGDSVGAGAALDQMGATFDVEADKGMAAAPAAPSTPSTPTNPSVAAAAQPPSTTTSVAAAAQPPSTPSSATTVAAAAQPPSTPSSTTVSAAAQPPSSPSSSPPGGPMTKAEEVFATAPPVVPMVNVGQSLVDQRMPLFMNHLMTLPKGFAVMKGMEVADNNPAFFDELYTASARAILKQGGWTVDNLQSGWLYANLGISGKPSEAELVKGISASTMPGYYLQRLVKLMLPVVTPIRHRFPATTPPLGATAAHWKAQFGYSNYVEAQGMYNVPEAGVSLSSTTGTGQTINESILDFAADYMRIALNNIVTLEAIYTSKGFDDPLQVAVLQALTMLLKIEERKIIGDNQAVIGRPASVSCTGGGSGTLGNSNDKFEVSALTYIGWLNSAVGGSTQVQGESNVRASSAVDISTKLNVAVSWPAVKGAVAYNVYYNPSGGGNHYYVGTYTYNAVTLTSLPTAGNAGPTSDGTANSNGFEALINWCELASIYSQTIPNRTDVFNDQSGQALTLVAPNSIQEFDELLEPLWRIWNITPTLILCSPQAALHAANKMGSQTNPAYRVNLSSGAQQNEIIGGLMATGYVNKFAGIAQGSKPIIDMMGHPYVPDGTYLFLSESIPYPYARQGTSFEIETQIPYTYFPLAQTTFAYPFGMIVKETVKCYHPAAQGAIVGVKVS